MTEPDLPKAHELRAEPDAPITVVRAGMVPYQIAWDWQRDLAKRRLDDEIGDVVLVLEHPAVFTAGRRADPANLVFSPTELKDRGIDVVEVDRGGDFTYHGPGQLVGYPIVKLAGIRGVVEYVRALEEVNIAALAAFGLTGRRIPDFTGVWVGEPPTKVTAIGVRVGAGGITQHGFAINVRTNLDDFSGIIPCGIQDKGVASLASLGVDVDMVKATEVIVHSLATVLRCEVREATPEQVGLDLGSVSSPT